MTKILRLDTGEYLTSDNCTYLAMTWFRLLMDPSTEDNNLDVYKIHCYYHPTALDGTYKYFAHNGRRDGFMYTDDAPQRRGFIKLTVKLKPYLELVDD